MNGQRLEFGYHAGLPTDATTAWGARGIIQNGTVRFLADRKAWLGEAADKERLSTWLDSNFPAIIKRVEDLIATGEIDGREQNDVVLAQDDEACCRANTNASGGYLYVVAFLRPVPKPYHIGYVADPDGNYGALDGSFVFFTPVPPEAAVEPIMAYDLGRFIRDHADALASYRVSYDNLPSDVLHAMEEEGVIGEEE